MGWFKHRHWWVREDAHSIKGEATTRGVVSHSGVVVLEQCSCGAVRTIQYGANIEPVIRVTTMKQAIRQAGVDE